MWTKTIVCSSAAGGLIAAGLVAGLTPLAPAAAPPAAPVEPSVPASYFVPITGSDSMPFGLAAPFGFPAAGASVPIFASSEPTPSAPGAAPTPGTPGGGDSPPHVPGDIIPVPDPVPEQSSLMVLLPLAAAVAVLRRVAPASGQGPQPP